MSQVVLPFLPGYMFDGQRVVSTGVAIPPSQHVDEKTGEIMYYVKPLFYYGANVGLFVKHKGIINWIEQANTN